jgi:HlyD family secretion protein
MKKRLIIAGILLAVAIAAGLVYRFENGRDKEGITLSGNVEVTEVNVAFKIPGRVRTLFTDEGRAVRKGEKIADLDSEEFVSLVNQSRAAVQNAEAQMEKAKSDYERYTSLFKDGVISPQQMVSAKTSYEGAASLLQMNRAALQTAEVRLHDSVVYSPLDGVVLRKNVEQGETVSAGTPVFTLGDLANPWIKVYVKEDKLGFVKLGQKAEVSVDSFPGKKYEGEVTYISSEAEFTPKTVQTQEERVKLVFGVKVSVKNVNNELKPSLPADVKILVMQ